MPRTKLLDDIELAKDQLQPDIPSQAVKYARKVMAYSIRYGDKIVVCWKDGHPYKTQKVEEVERDACSKHGTHVNRRGCYDYHASVWIAN